VKLADRIGRMQPSATIEVKAEADRLKEKGVDVIDFGPGEPDFDTPENVKAAAHRAIDANLSHYLPTLGLKKLRQAIAASYRSRYGSDYKENEVIVGCGAKSVLYAAMMAIVGPGDEVIIPAPYWVSFPEQAALAGGRPVILPTREDDGFVPRVSDAERLLTDRTRAIVLCSPSNPTGGVIPQDEIDRFARLAIDRDLYLIFDECYERFLYDGRTHTTPARSDGRLRDRLLLVSATSKTYAMTGWRVGYGLGSRELIGAMSAFQSHDTTHTSAVAQAAAAEALSGPQDSVATMLAAYTQRREAMMEGMRAVRGMACATPAGAFYVFPRVTGLYGRLGVGDSASVARFLLNEAAVATVPGEAFGAPGYLRFSYALSLERIREGLERIRRAAG
jgi:aspartate aminotransferase